MKGLIAGEDLSDLESQLPVGLMEECVQQVKEFEDQILLGLITGEDLIWNLRCGRVDGRMSKRGERLRSNDEDGESETSEEDEMITEQSKDSSDITEDGDVNKHKDPWTSEEDETLTEQFKQYENDTGCLDILKNILEMDCHR
eukprot:UN33495